MRALVSRGLKQATAHAGYLYEIDSVRCGFSSPKNLPDSHLGAAGRFLRLYLPKILKIAEQMKNQRFSFEWQTNTSSAGAGWAFVLWNAIADEKIE